MPANPPPAQLLPCPNPWCENPNGSGVAHHKRDGFRVLSCCGVATPRFPTRDEAIAAWNTRAPSPERGELASFVEALKASQRVLRASFIGRGTRASTCNMCGSSWRRKSREAHFPECQIGKNTAALHALSASPEGEGSAQRECPLSPNGRHQVDTSMESGPNNCFHCEKPMPTNAAQEQSA